MKYHVYTYIVFPIILVVLIGAYLVYTDRLTPNEGLIRYVTALTSTTQKAKTKRQLTQSSDAMKKKTQAEQEQKKAGPKKPKPIAPTSYKSNVPSNRVVRNSRQIVPKVVHYIWFYPKKKCNFRFHHHISMLSAYKYIKPVTIIVWNEDLPCGKWWNETKAKIPILQTKHMQAPTTIFGQYISVPEHRADVARLDIVMKYGGIYLDGDMVALKSWDTLLHYNITMAAPTNYNLANGVIIAVKTAKFLQLWMEAYHDFRDKKWGYNSLVVPFKLAKAHPDLIHIEWNTLIRPMFQETQWIFKPGMLWDWKGSYGMHLYYRFHKKDHNPEDIKKMNSTLGQVFRLIYYNTTKLMD